MRSRAPRFPADEQLQLMLRQLLGRAESPRIPPHPSPRVIRDIISQRLRAGPLTVGEQMTVVVLLVDHTGDDVAFWESALGDRSLHVTARCALLTALGYLAELSGRPLRLTMLTGEELKSLIEPRLLHDAMVHLADATFITDVNDLLMRLPPHRQLVYWTQAERCRRQAMISAPLMWGPLAFHGYTGPLLDHALDAIDAEAGPAAALLLSQVVRHLGSAPTAALVARRIPAMEAAPRRLDGLERLEVIAVRLAGKGGAMHRRVGFSLGHPEAVWLCGTFEFNAGDTDIIASQFDVTTLPPRLNPASIPAAAGISPVSGADFYDELLEGCRRAQRKGVDLPYPPLLVLSMLEGTAARDAPAARTHLS